MRLSEHEAETMRLVGAPFTEVHQWLDEFAGTPEYGMRHRKVRHHLAGIEQARAKFGDLGAEAARQHIISDLSDEGWDERCDPLPRNEEDYKRMGLWS